MPDDQQIIAEILRLQALTAEKLRELDHIQVELIGASLQRLGKSRELLERTARYRGWTMDGSRAAEHPACNDLSRSSTGARQAR